MRTTSRVSAGMLRQLQGSCWCIPPYLGHCDAAGWAHHACQTKICDLDMETGPVALDCEVQQLQAQREQHNAQQQDNASYSSTCVLHQDTATQPADDLEH
jgi:hypothetical protein